MNLAAKEIHAVRAACAGPMECVRPAADMSSHAVKTIPAARVSCVAMIQNATSAEGTIRPVVKGMFARNGLFVVQMVTAIPADAMRSSAVRKTCAERAMCVDQRGYASHAEAMNNHAVKQISFYHQVWGQSMFATKGTSAVRMTSVIPAEVMTSRVAKERCAKKVMSVDRMEHVTHVARTSLALVISATRVTTTTIPMESAINTAL